MPEVFIPALETVMVPVEKLTPYINNAKIHTEAQIKHIRKSIRDYGFNDPVAIWTNPETEDIEIVDGHGTVIAAKQEGMTEVPCNFLDHLSDEQRREYCHIHNQTQLETGFDYGALVADMDNLSCCWEDFGFEGYAYNGFDAISDLAENDFAENVTKSSGETFNITFTFPSDQREQIEAYVKDVSKQAIVDEIASRAVGQWEE